MTSARRSTAARDRGGIPRKRCYPVAGIRNVAIDSNGNRLSRTTPTDAESGTYDDQDRAVTYGKWSFTYTPNGELKTKTDTTNGDVTAYAFDGLGALRRVDLPDGRTIEYAVDPEGRRIAKKIDGAVVRRWLYGDDLRAYGGAYTDPQANGAVIRWNLPYATSLPDACGKPQFQNLDQILAHEIGHAFPYAVPNPVEAPNIADWSNRYATDFENVARGGPPYRLRE